METFGITESCPICDRDTLTITLQWDPYIPRGERSPEEGGSFQAVDWSLTCGCTVGYEFLKDYVDSIAETWIPDAPLSWMDEEAEPENEGPLMEDWDPDEIPDEESVDG